MEFEVSKIRPHFPEQDFGRLAYHNDSPDWGSKRGSKEKAIAFVMRRAFIYCSPFPLLGRDHKVVEDIISFIFISPCAFALDCKMKSLIFLLQATPGAPRPQIFLVQLLTGVSYFTDMQIMWTWTL